MIGMFGVREGFRELIERRLGGAHHAFYRSAPGRPRRLETEPVDSVPPRGVRA